MAQQKAQAFEFEALVHLASKKTQAAILILTAENLLVYNSVEDAQKVIIFFGLMFLKNKQQICIPLADMQVTVLPQSFLKLPVRVQQNKTSTETFEFINTALYSSFLTTIQSLGAKVSNEGDPQTGDAVGLFFNVEKQMETKFMNQVS
jgi:hypothetical protein